jgi:acetylornithine aminotransferase
MNLFDVYPINDINIVKAKGSYVWDDNNNKYLDMYGGHAVISIGHTHPHWVKRIEDQLNKIAFYSNSVRIPIQKELANKLSEVSGKENYQLFLVNSGAEANENALKLASFHTGRKKIVSFNKAFHGRTSLAVAVTDNRSIVAPVNETENVVFLPYNDEEALKKYFNENGEQVAAIIIEAIQGVGGITVANESFLRLIRNVCDEYGAVYVADEVQCGYGRTGRFFATDHAGIEADIYSMAKGMGNGFPIGGILISPKFKAKYGMLGTTFGGNHLACAAALGVLEVIQQERLIDNSKEVGKYLIDQLRDIAQVENARGKGLMIGFDLSNEIKELRSTLLMQYHIFTGEAKPNVIRLLPSLVISLEEVNSFLESMKAAIQSMVINQSETTII